MVILVVIEGDCVSHLTADIWVPGKGYNLHSRTFTLGVYNHRFGDRVVNYFVTHSYSQVSGSWYRGTGDYITLLCKIILD